MEKWARCAFDERQRDFFYQNRLFYESGAKAFSECPLGQLNLLNKYLIMHGATDNRNKITAILMFEEQTSTEFAIIFGIMYSFKKNAME